MYTKIVIYAYKHPICGKIESLLSLDTAITGSGDHENYFVQLNLTKYLMIHNNGASLNDECETIAVRIRTVSVHRMWPNIPKTTLLFSRKMKYYTIDALNDKNNIDFHEFHKTVKPKYG